MELQERVNQHDREIAAHTEQIKTLFNQQECLVAIAKSVAVLTKQMEKVEQGQSKVEAAVEELKSAPAKKWQLLISAIISALIGTGLGVLISNIFK